MAVPAPLIPPSFASSVSGAAGTARIPYAFALTLSGEGPLPVVVVTISVPVTGPTSPGGVKRTRILQVALLPARVDPHSFPVGAGSENPDEPVIVAAMPLAAAGPLLDRVNNTSLLVPVGTFPKTPAAGESASVAPP